MTRWQTQIHERRGNRRRWPVVVVATVLTLGATPLVVAQAPVAEPVSAAVKPLPAEDLERLVAPFALYPDDLVALILPASTVPIEIIQGERYLEERKKDANKPVPAKLSDPVKALLNYPDVIKLLTQDLDWCLALGEAVVADQGEVLAAVQSFRRRAQAAGNLKSDDKLTVVVETETIKIVPSDPQVLYVPYYDPATVVYAGYPYSYWPYGYPVYYYPYAPGAAFAAGVIWGAAIGAIWNGGHYVMHHGGGGYNNINIDIDRGDRGSLGGNRPQPKQWTPSSRPGEVGSIGGRNQLSNRVGDAGRGAAAGGAGATLGGRAPGSAGAGGTGGVAGGRPGAGAGAGAGGGATAGQRPAGGAGQGATGAAAAGARDVGGASRGGNAFDSYGGSGRQTQLNSSRGASSRSFSGSGGGARGGGGRRR